MGRWERGNEIRAMAFLEYRWCLHTSVYNGLPESAPQLPDTSTSPPQTYSSKTHAAELNINTQIQSGALSIYSVIMRSATSASLHFTPCRCLPLRNTLVLSRRGSATAQTTRCFRMTRHHLEPFFRQHPDAGAIHLVLAMPFTWMLENVAY